MSHSGLRSNAEMLARAQALDVMSVLPRYNRFSSQSNTSKYAFEPVILAFASSPSRDPQHDLQLRMRHHHHSPRPGLRRRFQGKAANR